MSSNPFVTHTYKSWKYFLSDNQYFADDMGFVFRGHGCESWNLETTLDRLIKRIDPKDINLDSTYDFLLNEFIHSARARSGAKKDAINNNEELWAIGQHYGLATPLLDWTRSLYVALFFAFENPSPAKNKLRSVWALNTSPPAREIMNNSNAKIANTRHHFKIVDPISDENPRLISQSGLFSRQPIGFNLVNWVLKEFPPDAPYLIKINIPESERFAILNHLRLMNIHHGTLFPDIEGAAKYSNHTLELLAQKQKLKSKLP
jgi:hypothetical protein